MELKQLGYVVALAEECNFTRAAARCFVAQSALSHAIKNLETELGVQLFSRSSRRVELTAAGEAFLPAARESLRAAERAAVEAAAAEGHIRGQISVGVIPTVTAVNVSAAMRDFRERHPQVRILFQVAGSEEIERGIIRGDIDVGFLGLPETRPPRGVAFRRLAVDRLVLVVHRDHRLAGRARVRLADLADETFADFPAGTPAREESDLAFAAAGVVRDVEFESMATNLTLDLVLHSLAIALLPSGYAPEHPSLASIPIVDGPTRVEYVAWSTFNPSPAAHAFLESVDASNPASPSANDVLVQGNGNGDGHGNGYGQGGSTGPDLEGAR